MDELDGVPGTSAEGCAEFAEQYERFKRRLRLRDFADMLREYARFGKPLEGVKFAVVDEAQDLTAAQWAVVRRAFANADRLLVAGDDDQTIYAFAGARPAHFIALGTEAASVTMLEQSRRIPSIVHGIAHRIAQQIAMRYAKTFRPREAAGSIGEHSGLGSLTLGGAHARTRVLARHDYLLDPVEARLRDEGLVYTRRGRPSVHPKDVALLKAWVARPAALKGELLKSAYAALGQHAPPSLVPAGTYDLAERGIDVTRDWRDAFLGWSQARRDYYASVLAEGRRLSDAPTIHLSTIHAAKGAEAERVILLTEMSTRALRGFDRAPDDERRVFYVGVTRAIERLDLVYPDSGRGFPLDF
jgi:DNA helicase-2/ATP-dependent DNA helicase PcrA